MLTKNDLKEIAKLIKPLKDDLSTTKADMTVTKREILAVNAHNSRIEMNLLEMRETFEKNLEKWKSEICDKIDPILNRVKSAEEEKTILEARQDEREKLDNRLKKLEEIHPNIQHPHA